MFPYQHICNGTFGTGLAGRWRDTLEQEVEVEVTRHPAQMADRREIDVEVAYESTDCFANGRASANI